MSEKLRGTTPVDEDQETEEETPTKVQPDPEKIKKIDAKPEDQKDINEWVERHRP